MRDFEHVIVITVLLCHLCRHPEIKEYTARRQNGFQHERRSTSNESWQDDHKGCLRFHNLPIVNNTLHKQGTMFPPVLSIDWFNPGRLSRFLLIGFINGAAAWFQKRLSIWTVAAITTAVLSVVEWGLERIAWGKSRTLDWENEVVVVTGGSSGLGRVIVDTYRMRGVRVAVLDVNAFEAESDEGMESLKFYQCDIGDMDAIQRVTQMVEKEVGNLFSLHWCPRIFSLVLIPRQVGHAHYTHQQCWHCEWQASSFARSAGHKA